MQKKLAELNAYVTAQPSGISDFTEATVSSAAKVAETGAPTIADFEQSGVLNSKDVQLYVEDHIPLIHLRKLTKIVYADTYRYNEESQPVLGEIIYNPVISTYDTIIIYKQPSDIDDMEREMKMTIAHEIGHNVYFNVLDNAALAEWEGLCRTGEGYVTSYARRNLEEDFAESYAYYILKPRVLLDADGKKYAFLRDRVFQGREYL